MRILAMTALAVPTCACGQQSAMLQWCHRRSRPSHAVQDPHSSPQLVPPPLAAGSLQDQSLCQFAAC